MSSGFMKWQTYDFKVVRAPECHPEIYVVTNKHAAAPQIKENGTYISSNLESCTKAQNPHQLNSVNTTWKMRFRAGNIMILALPIGAAFLPALFILSAYIHAESSNSLILKNNTDTPYVSDIGNFKPYSSLFTFGLVLNAILFLGVVLVRFYHVKSTRNCQKSNYVGLICGVISTVGELTTCAFQLSSHHTVHFLGAFVFFTSIAFFCCIQTWITFKQLPDPCSKFTKIIFSVRLLLSVIIVMDLILLGTFLHPHLSNFNRTGFSVAQKLEWILVSCIMLFVLLFLYEFKGIKPEFAVAPLSSGTELA